MCRHHLTPNRRQMLAMTAALPLVAGCKPQQVGPEEIRWGREVCEICGMIISEPRYAAEVRGGPDRRLAKFDDIGDAVHWLRVQDWAHTSDVEFWVMNSDTGMDWVDARQARYLTGQISPMDYGFAAVMRSGVDTVSFAHMEKAVIAKGLTSRCLPTEGQES